MSFIPPFFGGFGLPPPPSSPTGPGAQPGGGAGGSQSDAPPTSPPPSFVPQQSPISPFAIDPGAISSCRRRFTYVWLNNGDGFWYYPTFVGRQSVAGYRWFGFFWFFHGVDLRQIQSFTCF